MRLLLLSLPFLCGCTNTIVPAPALTDPVTIELRDHGRHPSLIIPLSDGTFVRYAYGDWGWYALGHTGVIQGIDALLLPSKGALGRKILTSPDDFALLRRRDPAKQTYSITVEGKRAAALHQTLDAAFREQGTSAHFNATYDLEFVHSPESYWALHNCNHVMANWLRALGCRVRGTAAFSSWRIKS
jgi:hypothetical protein